MGKIYEKIILIRLLESNPNLIIAEQFGFRSEHSTTLQLVRILDNITKNFNTNRSTALLALDINRAFDTVWHSGLIHKMIQNNIPGYITKIITSFLHRRSFQVSVNNTLSNTKFIPAGVPQGSTLSPLLFNIYMNDIPKGKSTEIALFADDTAIYSNSFKINKAFEYIQNHVNTLEKYYDKWKIKINTEKTVMTHFTKKKKDTCSTYIHFYDDQITNEEVVKYLGVKLDKTLNFNEHTKHIASKANGAISLLYPLLNKSSPLNKKLKLLLYKQCVQPIMLYACPAWNSTNKNNIKKLQIIQNKCLRMALNKPIETPIYILHQEAGINEIETEIYNKSSSFFSCKVKNTTLTKSIGRITDLEGFHFRKKHKLVNEILLKS